MYVDLTDLDVHTHKYIVSDKVMWFFCCKNKCVEISDFLLSHEQNLMARYQVKKNVLKVCSHEFH